MTKNFVDHNTNPFDKNTGDCVIRALSLAMNKSWGDVMIDLAYVSANFSGMMVNNVRTWGHYLEENGWRKIPIDYQMNVKYTISTVNRVALLSDKFHGRPIICSVDGHLVTCYNGKYFDTWDSGRKKILAIWVKDDFPKDSGIGYDLIKGKLMEVDVKSGRYRESGIDDSFSN